MIAADIGAFAAALPAVGAVMGLDFGEKTIGVAVSDRMRSVASPLETVRRAKFTADAGRLMEIAAAREIAGLWTSLKRRLDEQTAAAEKAAAARALAVRTPYPDLIAEAIKVGAMYSTFLNSFLQLSDARSAKRPAAESKPADPAARRE